MDTTRTMQILDHALNCVPKGGENKVAAARAAVAQLVESANRYEKVRTFAPHEFLEVWNRCMYDDVKFDAAIDAMLKDVK